MGFHNIPILTYHKISKRKERNSYTIEEKDFNDHIKYLYKNNYKSILVYGDVKSLLQPSFSIPDKTVIITFDDGYESDFTIALPILKRYNFKATFFITSDWIDTDGYMNKEQLRMLKAEGMSVQSHAKTHFFLDAMNRKEICEEIKGAKDVLENVLDNKISFLSLPGGRYNEHVINCARNLNLEAVFSSDPFHYQSFGDIELIGRCMLKYTLGRIEFEKIVNMSWGQRTKIIGLNFGKKISKKILGNDVYHSIWKMFVKKNKNN